MTVIASSSGGGIAGVTAAMRVGSRETSTTSSSSTAGAGPSSAQPPGSKPPLPEHLSTLGSPKSKKQKQKSAGLAAKERRKAMVYEVKEPRSSMPFIEQVWMTFELTSFSPLAFWYAQFQLLVILFSTLSFTLETELNCKPFSLAEHGFLTPENCGVWESVWTYSEYVAVAVFTFELVCRFLSCPSKRYFVQGVMNWIDLIAILPFYIELGVAAALGGDDSVLSAFSVFRVVRLVRVFRVFKMGKSSSGMKMMASTMAESLKVLTVLVFMVLIAVIVFSSAVYSFEQSGPYKNDFESIPRSFWWALVTMTTVGYGDISPITPLGRFVAVFAMFSGIIIVALPITVIGANFEKQFEKQFFTDELVQQVTLDDGTVDYAKLMELFKQLDQRGNLLVPIPKSEQELKVLVAEYDVQGKGKLDQEDWASFILDCVCEAHEFTAVTINKVVVDVHRLKTEVASLREELELYRLNSDHQYEELKAMLLGEEPPRPMPPRLTGESAPGGSESVASPAAARPTPAAEAKPGAAATPVAVAPSGTNGGAGVGTRSAAERVLAA